MGLRSGNLENVRAANSTPTTVKAAPNKNEAPGNFTGAASLMK